MSADADRLEPGGDAARRPPRRRKAPTLATAGAVFAAGRGLVIGGRSLQDNSFFTHLATGRLIVGSGSIPHHDPYSFTARGTSWVVQSWLVSLVYGLLDRSAGAIGIRLLVGITAAAVAWLCWQLTRPAGSLLPRAVLLALLLFTAPQHWIERPLLFGLLGLVLTIYAAQGHVNPRWLAPIFWLWANSHGSFPLGLAVLALYAAGSRLDGRSPAVELRCLQWAVGGTALAVVNPFGPALLLFPVHLLGRHDALSVVLEWQPPRFDTVDEGVLLAVILLAAVGLARRPSWRQALVFVVFVPASLLAARNVPVTCLVLLPGLACAASGLGGIDAERRSWAAGALAAISVLASLVTVAARPDYQLAKFPVASVSFLESQGLVPNGRVLTPDIVGNYLELRYGTNASVFYDDRYDMYPIPVLQDGGTLIDGRPGWQAALARWHLTAVLAQTDSGITQLLAISPGWRVAFTEPGWVVLEPR